MIPTFLHNHKTGGSATQSSTLCFVRLFCTTPPHFTLLAREGGLDLDALASLFVCFIDLSDFARLKKERKHGMHTVVCAVDGQTQTRHARMSSVL